MNVKRLTGTELNFWVAKSLGLKLSPLKPPPGALHDPDCGYWHPDTFQPATNWLHAGPVLASEWFAIEDTLNNWFGDNWAGVRVIQESATLWFMRAYVASQFGDEVEEIARIPGYANCVSPPEPDREKSPAPPLTSTGHGSLIEQLNQLFLHWKENR